MRKSISVLLSVLFAFSMLVIPTSAEEGVYVYTENGYDITVYTEGLEEHQIENIILCLTSEDPTDEGISTYNLICDVFGHKIEDSKSVSVYHNVYDEAPHCMQLTYLMHTCTRCDHATAEVVQNIRVSCH